MNSDTAQCCLIAKCRLPTDFHTVAHQSHLRVRRCFDTRPTTLDKSLFLRPWESEIRLRIKADHTTPDKSPWWKP
jgi:hypothetical protein